jgi:hypothetical protein
MKIKFIILLLFIVCSPLIAQQLDYYSEYPNVKLYINFGLSYHFPITTDYYTQTESLFLDVPLTIGVDIRTREWVSFYTGLELIYGINYQKFIIEDEFYTFYTNSFFIRIPLIAKFYPLVKKNEAFHNFYLGVGGVLHFWPINYYYIITPDNLIHTGNAYQPYHNEHPPGNIYTPANLGFKFCIGNDFYVSNKILLGVEFYTTYLFLPYLNGYYFNQNYNRGENVILEFDLNIGLVFSIGIDLNG